MESVNNPGYEARLSFPKRLIYLFLRTFFKLLYHQFSWSYDLVAWIVSLGNWQKWILSSLPYLEGPTILEIGFGPGHLLLALRQKNIHVFGLDESHQMIRIAQHRLSTHAFSPNLIRGVAQTLPFADDSFHQVVITFPAEYIVNPATFQEIKRVLVRGGSALVLPLAWITGRKPLERLAAWVNRITGEAPRWNPKVLDPLREVGFEVDWEMIEHSNSECVLIHLKKP